LGPRLNAPNTVDRDDHADCEKRTERTQDDDLGDRQRRKELEAEIVADPGQNSGQDLELTDTLAAAPCTAPGKGVTGSNLVAHAAVDGRAPSAISI
jgi:hypothetical protein